MSTHRNGWVLGSGNGNSVFFSSHGCSYLIERFIFLQKNFNLDDRLFGRNMIPIEMAGYLFHHIIQYPSR